MTMSESITFYLEGNKLLPLRLIFIAGVIGYHFYLAYAIYTFIYNLKIKMYR